MTEEVAQQVTGENVTPEAEQENNSENNQLRVELRDGKLYTVDDGNRLYTRAEHNKIKSALENTWQQERLKSLGVESWEDAQRLIQTSREVVPPEQSTDTETQEAYLKSLKTQLEAANQKLAKQGEQMVMDKHIRNFRESLGDVPAKQKDLAVELAVARGLLEVRGDTAYIRHKGELMVNDEGTGPDYEALANLMGEELEFSRAKPGIRNVETDRGSNGGKSQPKTVDRSRLLSDRRYGEAFQTIVTRNPDLTDEQISHEMVLKQANLAR